MNRFFTLHTLFHDLRHLALLLIVGLIVACSSSATDPQPNAAFEGTYTGKMVSTTKSGNQTFAQTTDKLTVGIKPGTAPATLTVQFFEDSFGEISDPLAATVRGSTLTIAKQKTPGYPDHSYEGSATLSGETLALTLTDTDSGSTQVQAVTATRP